MGGTLYYNITKPHAPSHVLSKCNAMFHEDLAVEYKILGITSGHEHLQRKQQEVWIRSGGASSMIFPYLRGFVSMQRLSMRVGRNDEDFI